MQVLYTSPHYGFPVQLLEDGRGQLYLQIDIGTQRPVRIAAHERAAWRLWDLRDDKATDGEDLEYEYRQIIEGELAPARDAFPGDVLPNFGGSKEEVVEMQQHAAADIQRGRDSMIYRALLNHMTPAQIQQLLKDKGAI